MCKTQQAEITGLIDMPSALIGALVKVAEVHGFAAYNEGNRARVVVPWYGIEVGDHGYTCYDVRTWSELRLVLGY